MWELSCTNNNRFFWLLQTRQGITAVDLNAFADNITKNLADEFQKFGDGLPAGLAQNKSYVSARDDH